MEWIRAVIQRLNEKVNSLIALLNQFFDLVKIESEDYDIPLSKISLSEICRNSVLEFYDLLVSRNLRVEIDIPELPFYFLGNKDALHRILSNLISNSIRYGSDGGVFGLTVREEGEYVAVDVWDRGKGIAEVHQERVFERLYTLDDARNPQFQGSGLGLADETGELERIQCPVLVIWGVKDLITTQQMTQEIKEDFASHGKPVQYVSLDAGHSPLIDDLHGLAAAVQAFIALP